MGDTKVETPLHPLATKILGSIKAQDDGAASAIPDGVLAAIERKLAASNDDKLLFAHLCVLHIRLASKGLVKAADQLLDLAKIGLTDVEVAQTIERTDPRREITQKLTGTVASRSTPAGLKRGAQVGVGLRGNTNATVKIPPRK